MDWKSLFHAHIDLLVTTTSQALEDCNLDGVVIDSGPQLYVFEDDQTYPFRANHHFLRWCPVNVPNSLLHIEKGKSPTLYFYAPDDYWHDSPDLGDGFWQDRYPIKCLSSTDEIWDKVKGLKRTAYHGPSVDKAKSFGLVTDIEKTLTPQLDWYRSFKTHFEEAATVWATEKAAKGHKVARDAFFAGASEYEVHTRYLGAVGDLEPDMPYGTIVAFDNKAAILHYTAKRRKGSGKVFLIDAGAKAYGYASDITRTYYREDVPAPMQVIVAGVEALQKEVCASLKPGVSFPDIHLQAHEKIADLLLNVGVLQNVGPEEALAKGSTNPFFPHGIGHMLGLLVHDVAGKQADVRGTLYDTAATSQDPRFRFLRSHRVFAERNLFTVEPGVYFIPLLLDPLRGAKEAAFFNWNLIDECLPYGGVRIEDNVLITEDGVRNITREFLP